MNPLRVVSLLPSATEILHALGLGETQVGRSHECDFPVSVQELPVCTRPAFNCGGTSSDIDRLVKERLSSAASIYELDASLLGTLRPTHVLTQTLCDVCAVSFADVQVAFNTESGLCAEIVSLKAGCLQGVWLDIRTVAATLGCISASEALISSLQGRMAEMEQTVAEITLKPRVAAIEWVQPLMAAGNWVPELIARAGGDNLFGIAGRHSPWMEWEALRSADPDVIVALPCGFDLGRTLSEMPLLTAQAGWDDLQAVRSGAVYVCDGNQFMNRPGPRLVESLQIFCEILHPSIFEPALEGIGWQRYMPQ